MGVKKSKVATEVIITSELVKQLAIYRGLGGAEVWQAWGRQDLLPAIARLGANGNP
ncbi:MAG: hypothetical protein AAF892_07480 [Cyanobacteria bacterium P01_D01_bin.71]